MTLKGPQDLTGGELGRYGLGVVVRVLGLPGAPVSELLRRLYCLLCGRAVEHEVRLAQWWICGRDCNAPASHSGSAGENEVPHGQ